MKKHKTQRVVIKPRNEGETVSNLHLYMDDTEIKHIRSLKIEVTPNEIPRMILDINLYDISIDSEFLLYQKGVGAINFETCLEEPAEE